MVFKSTGTFIPKWEDIQDDLEPDFRELLLQKKKRKEALTPELESIKKRGANPKAREYATMR